ncbi:MAG: protein sphX, partial [bacterium]
MVLVGGVSGDVNALGYFGFAYYVRNRSKLKLVAIDDERDAGPISPSSQTVANGTYQPLSRPLFIYASVPALQR